MHIRSANVNDRDSVFALVEQLASTYNVDRAAFSDAFDHALSNDDHVLLVAEMDDRVVGYVLMTIARLMYTRDDAAQIQELIVDAGSRASGVGSALVHAVEDLCRARALTQLSVASSRGAAFYDRLDYRSTADFLKKSFIELD